MSLSVHHTICTFSCWLGMLLLAALVGCRSVPLATTANPASALRAMVVGKQVTAELPEQAGAILNASPPPKSPLFDYPLARLLNYDQLVPSNDRDWSPELAQLATAKFETGNKVAIQNVRNGEWLTAVDCLVKYENRTYDLNDLETVDFIVVPFNDHCAIAHTLLSFGFGKGDYVGISVEVRKERGEVYSSASGLARQFELIYVVADEHDLLPVRVKERASDVYIYRSTAPPEKVRALFLDMLKRANQLAEQPEFYDTFTNNCTTNIVQHINTLSPGRVPYDYRILLPGYSDQLAYELGLLDNRIPFAELRRRAWAAERIVKYEHSPDFSAKIRR